MKDKLYRITTAYLKQRGTSPPISYLVDVLKTDSQTISTLVKELIAEGKLKKRGQKVEPVTEKISPGLSLKHLIAGVLYLTAIGFIYISGANSFDFLKTLFEPVRAFIFAVGTVVFSSLVFALPLKNFPLKWLVRLAGVVVILLSIVSTIGGRFYILLESENKVETLEYTMLLKQKERLQEDYLKAKQDVELYTHAVRNRSTGDDRTAAGGAFYITDNRFKKEAEKVLREKEKALTEKEKEITAYLKKGGPVYTKDLYSWTAKIFNSEKEFIKFLILIIPSIIIDLIAPICLYLAVNIDDFTGGKTD